MARGRGRDVWESGGTGRAGTRQSGNRTHGLSRSARSRSMPRATSVLSGHVTSSAGYRRNRTRRPRPPRFPVRGGARRSAAATWSPRSRVPVHIVYAAPADGRVINTPRARATGRFGYFREFSSRLLLLACRRRRWYVPSLR